MAGIDSTDANFAGWDAFCRKVFGRYWNDWISHLVTLSPVTSQVGDSGFRIAFTGSPDIERPMHFDLPGFKIAFAKTKVTDAEPVDATAAPETPQEAADDAELNALEEVPKKAVADADAPSADGKLL